MEGERYLGADSPLLLGIVCEKFQRVDVSLLAGGLPTSVNQGNSWINRGSGEEYPGISVSIRAHIRIFRESGLACGLFGSDVGEEGVEKYCDRVGAGVGSTGTGGPNGIGGGLLARVLSLGGLVVELLFWNDPVGDACLGSYHEGGH